MLRVTEEYFKVAILTLESFVSVDFEVALILRYFGNLAKVIKVKPAVTVPFNTRSKCTFAVTALLLTLSFLCLGPTAIYEVRICRRRVSGP
jgi:hypothetical protein